MEKRERNEKDYQNKVKNLTGTNIFFFSILSSGCMQVHTKSIQQNVGFIRALNEKKNATIYICNLN